jgi:NodT family efflux transporter outer membrane factor (OMF) lipoprotein
MMLMDVKTHNFRNAAAHRAAALGSALIAIGLLAGCVVGPNFRRPAPPTAAGYLMAGDQPLPKEVVLGPRGTGPWWRSLGSSDLDATIALALSGNATLAEAEANLDRAKAAVTAARAGLYPELGVNAGAERERLNLQSFGLTLPGIPADPTFNLYSVGATASYIVPTSGGVRRQAESAAAAAEAQRRRAEAAALALTGQVAQEAATIGALRGELAALDDVLSDDRRLVDLARTAIEAGGASSGRRVGALSQLASDEAAAPPLRQSLAAARHALAVLVGKTPGDWTAPDFDLESFTAPTLVPVSLPSELVRRRPDILAAEAQLHEATANVGVATARLYPNLTLSGALTQSSLTPDKIFNFPSTGYSLGLALTQPIFDAGRLRAERREAEGARRAALAVYEATVSRAFSQVADLLQALGHDQEELLALERTIKAAEADLRLAEAGYRAGGLGITPAIDAQRNLSNAKRSLVQARARKLQDLVELSIATAADIGPITPH